MYVVAVMHDTLSHPVGRKYLSQFTALAKEKDKESFFVGIGGEKVVRSQSISRFYAINVSCKNHGSFYVYLTVETVFSQAIPGLFPPGIVTSSRRVARPSLGGHMSDNPDAATTRPI